MKKQLGAQCPTDGHGPLLEIDGGLWCPHQTHDDQLIRRTFPAADVKPTAETAAGASVSPARSSGGRYLSGSRAWNEGGDL